MKHFTASIEYNSETLPLLARTINNVFRLRIKFFYLTLCIILLIAGAVLGWQTPQGVACIALGCFLLPSVRALERSGAQKAIRQLNGQPLKVTYDFQDHSFTCSSHKEHNEYAYSSIIRLLEDNHYFYMFPNTSQAYMINKSSLLPNQPEQFRMFIREQVGLQWTAPVSLATLNLRQIQFNRRNTR